MTEFTREFIAEERERVKDNPNVGFYAIVTGIRYRAALDEIERLQAELVALHNAAPSLIAELEAARKVCELITLWAGVEMTTLHPDIAKALRKWQKARGEG